MKALLFASALSLTFASTASALSVKQAEKWMQFAKGGSGSAGQIKCSKGRIFDRRLKKCVLSNSPDLDDGSRVEVGIWLAKRGRHEDAIATLAMVGDKSNTLAQTYIGYAHRKQGRMKLAFSHYRAALASDPQNWIARSYLGEALLQNGNLSAARDQLSRIKAGCGANCSTYKRLAGALVITENRGSN